MAATAALTLSDQFPGVTGCEMQWDEKGEVWIGFDYQEVRRFVPIPKDLIAKVGKNGISGTDAIRQTIQNAIFVPDFVTGGVCFTPAAAGA